ncbi:MAG: sulfite exporter TauE/SafE family protein [Acidobacteria bacterium]|nr:sulfite exporter TauE/SafE family protein [Acidobacteriota bacterium]
MDRPGRRRTLTPLEILIIILAVTVGSAVQSAAGIGAGTIAAPIAAVIDTDFLPGPMLVMGLVLTLLMTLRERGHAKMDDVGWALAGRVPGALIGLAILVAFAKEDLRVFFGALILLAVAVSLAPIHVAKTRSTLIGAGFASGLSGTTTSIGGPPMALVMQRQEGPEVRGTLSTFFLIGVSFSLCGLALTGSFPARDLDLAALVVLPTIAGFVIGGRFREVLDRGWVRPALLTLAAAGGVALIIRGVVG